MARYRKIESKIWGDEKFRNLEPFPCTGQSVWISLIIGPYTTNLPGLISVGEMSICERMKWPLKAFRHAFRDAFQQGMVKADWNAPLIWLPNALKYNKPSCPNLVGSWKDEWELLPECNLKAEAHESMRAHIYSFGKGFRDAFDKAFGKGIRHTIKKAIEDGMSNPVTVTETVTEDKRSLVRFAANEIEKKKLHAEKKKPKPKKSDEWSAEYRRFYYQHYPRQQGGERGWKAWKAKRLDPHIEELIAIVEKRKLEDFNWADCNKYVPLPASFINGKLWNDEITREPTSSNNQAHQFSAFDTVCRLEAEQLSEVRNPDTKPICEVD